MTKIAPVLETIIIEKMAEHQVPGVVVGILQDGEMHTQGFGVTNIDHPLDVSAETIFQIGSNTKTMTATVMMLLAEQGKLDWDAPVRHYVPEFKVVDEEASANATVRHLMTHSAGWFGDHFVSFGAGDDAKEKFAQDMAGLEQLAPFGRIFSYNNAAFALAGHIIERITGQRYEDAMQELLFTPLGMTNSYFDASDVMIHRFAVGHHVLESGVEVGHPWALSRCMYSAGAVACTAADLLKYARFYLDGGLTAAGEQLATPQAIQQMWTHQFEVNASMGDAVGTSWFITDHDGVTSYSHGGATVGQISAFEVIPEKNFAFCIFTNANTGRQFNPQVAAYIREHFCDIAPPTPLETVAWDEVNSAEFLGTYRNRMIQLELVQKGEEVWLNHTQLRGFPEPDSPIHQIPAAKVAPLPNGNLRILEGPMRNNAIQVVRHEDGAIGWLRLGGRIHPRC